MKKIIPLILLILGIVVFAAIFFILRGDKSSDTDEEVVPEVALELRPIASLTPTEDGHWLDLNISKIVIEAETVDYELLYRLPDGRTQGVPGTVQLKGEGSIERMLLLGSESSGKFRYDEGVEQGTLTLRFRNKKGKLVAKFSTEFRLTNKTDELSSIDGKFTYKLEESSAYYFVIMETFGVPKLPQGNLESGPYGIFSSATKDLPGEIAFNTSSSYFRFDKDELVEIKDKKSSKLGIFIAVGE